MKNTTLMGPDICNSTCIAVNKSLCWWSVLKVASRGSRTWLSWRSLISRGVDGRVREREREREEGGKGEEEGERQVT